MLATFAENGSTQSEEARETVHEYMKPFKIKKVENIILGCTHYPIYDQIIREELGYNVNLINTGKSVANYLKSIFYKDKFERKRKTRNIFE